MVEVVVLVFVVANVPLAPDAGAVHVTVMPLTIGLTVTLRGVVKAVFTLAD